MPSPIVDIHPHIISDNEDRYPPATLFGKRSEWSQVRPATVETLMNISGRSRAGLRPGGEAAVSVTPPHFPDSTAPFKAGP